MAGKGAKFLKNKQVAKLVTENRQPCIFCQQDVDDEVIYGKLYSLVDIQCHYFCVLLSCCLIQKGSDNEGLLGFLYKDIIAEVERSKKHKCSYCGRGGASLGCAVSACRKQFHLPCGRRKNAVSLFYKNYKSFCELHAPKQKISDEVMVNVKLRLKQERMLKSKKKSSHGTGDAKQDHEPEESPVCVICYEEVPGCPSTQTFWPPCCGRDAWLHRSCLQRMALSAGMHYIKCPLCNDKEQFYEAVCRQGYYLPDRDAAWELEQDAFAEIYERPESCAAPECCCPFGRSHDEPGIWDIKLCMLCGSSGMHARCLGAERMLCAACRPAAQGIDQLESRLASVIKAEQEREARAVRSGPVMPSRMSLRRTKGRLAALSASSSSKFFPIIEPKTEIKTEPTSKEYPGRLDLNLKTPKRPKFLEPSILKDLENKLLSPIKMLEQRYMEKLDGKHDLLVDSAEVIEKMRAKFNKPKPLSEKKRIVNEILDDLFRNVFMENLEGNDLVKNWSSPKKCFEVIEECNKESKENQDEKVTDAEKSQNQIEEIHQGNNENIKTDDSQEEKINLVDKLVENLSAGEIGDNDDNDDDESTSTFELPPELIAVSDDSLNDTRHSTAEENDNTKSDNDENDGDESTSTFKLPQVFIKDSDDSLNGFETPKTLKTVDIEHNSSLEISERDDVININMIEIGNGKEQEFIKTLIIKSPVKDNKCSFKFSALDKETLETDHVDMDVDKFKNHYLNEVDRDFKCSFNHNHVVRNDNDKNDKAISTAIDFAVHANRKRKLDASGVNERKIKKKKSKKTEDRDTERVKKNKKREGQQKRIKMKIKWNDGKEKSKKLKKKQKMKTFKQYVLKYSPIQSSKVIAKPDIDVSPMKRKYKKLEKSPDKLVQTSIHSFFKVK